MENSEMSFENRIPLSEIASQIDSIKGEVSKVIMGQQELIELLVVSLLVEGHVLIEGVPGIAKTLTAKLFARTLYTGFSRIQFTPDLMPSDILGTSVFNVKSSEFEFKKGPVFSNLILIDEINRSPAKTQAALFELMEEKQVTMDGTTYAMGDPFMVIATQNPIEQEGTYALPEAQLDRFLFKLKVGYPSLEEEVDILKSHDERNSIEAVSLVQPVLNPETLHQIREYVKQVVIDEKILGYIAALVGQTRSHPHLYMGASPRASIACMNASKALAIMSGRDFVTPEDVKRSLAPVLNHRLLLTPEREMEGMSTETVIQMITENTEIPR